jgi:hypothetical protein
MSQYNVLKILNNVNNPIKDRKNWWSNTTLYSTRTNGKPIEVIDYDINATWHEAYWSKWIAAAEQWCTTRNGD